jgi:hypothetical protein
MPGEPVTEYAPGKNLKVPISQSSGMSGFFYKLIYGLYAFLRVFLVPLFLVPRYLSPTPYDRTLVRGIPVHHFPDRDEWDHLLSTAGDSHFCGMSCRIYLLSREILWWIRITHLHNRAESSAKKKPDYGDILDYVIFFVYPENSGN